MFTLCNERLIVFNWCLVVFTSCLRRRGLEPGRPVGLPRRGGRAGRRKRPGPGPPRRPGRSSQRGPTRPHRTPSNFTEPHRTSPARRPLGREQTPLRCQSAWHGAARSAGPTLRGGRPAAVPPSDSDEPILQAAAAHILAVVPTLHTYRRRSRLSFGEERTLQGEHTPSLRTPSGRLSLYDDPTLRVSWRTHTASLCPFLGLRGRQMTSSGRQPADTSLYPGRPSADD